MKISGIPHKKQSKETSCGAAALFMVYQYLERNDQTEEVLWKRLKTERPGFNGQFYLQTDIMAKDAKEQGLSYFLAQAVLDSPELALQPIKEFLSLSIPVIVCQKISQTEKLGHFRVVIGIEGDNIILNDPIEKQGDTIISVDDFIDLWKKTDNGEVIEGQFFAIFNKEQIKKDNKFTVYKFESSIKYFSATSLEFI